MWLAAGAAMLFLNFFGLTDVGVIGPDEPRYASIGQEMARSGDWITPRLWGKPWFEKPPLVYWMTGLASLAGLGKDLAPRLPVALLNVGFLVLFYRLLGAEFGRRAAFFATAILGTSAMWVAFAHIGATDLPMSATFTLAMLAGLRWNRSGKRRWLAVSGALLGVAVLAKGLVPLALSFPLLWLGRRRLPSFLGPAPVGAFLAVAGPWYLACWFQNGSAFIDEFFVRHHFGRFSTDALMHQQPFWFYLPVLAAGVFPWTPLLVALFRRSLFRDERRRFILLWLAFGFVFFSMATNKLPGYLLPLFPAVAILGGLALDEMRDARWVLAPACALLLLVPVVAGSLPGILTAGGLSRATLGGWSWSFAITYLSLAAVIWWFDEIGRREGAAGLLVLATVFGVVYIKVKAFPAIDRLATARPLWQRIEAQAVFACVEEVHRNWRYGLNYYSGTPLPECSQTPRPIRVRQLPGKPPFVN